VSLAASLARQNPGRVLLSIVLRANLSCFFVGAGETNLTKGKIMVSKKQCILLLIELVSCSLLSCGVRDLLNDDTYENGENKEIDDTVFATFKAEKTEWEKSAITEYYLTLTHQKGLSRYTTTALIKDDTPQYIETGGVSVTLTDNFPFSPLAETVQEIYETLEDAFRNKTSIDVSFDALSHTPISITLNNYNGSGDNYVIIIDSVVIAQKEEPLIADGEEYVDAKVFNMTLFNAEKEAWFAQDMQDYRYIINTFLDFPTVPVLITVSANSNSEFECPSGFSKADFEQAKERDLLKFSTFGKTIDELYSEIEYRIKEDVSQYSDKDQDEGAKIAVVYNTEYHYPEYFSIIYYRGNEIADGGGMSFRISGFERLK
jgi:hypothetical protein